MGKSRKNSIMKNIGTTASQTLPVVDKSLKNVGTAAKDVAQASIPIVEKGVSALYGTMSTGLDLGVKGVKNVGKTLKIPRRSRHRSISRGRSRTLSRGRTMNGGRRRRRHSRRH
jgi:hypothetical protein